MIGYRALVALVALVTAMLVQATVIGPTLVTIPASLVLVLVLSAALLAGPGTGIGLGFGAGLLADLASTHPVGVLAFTWLAGGVCAGILGGVAALNPGAGSSNSAHRGARVRWARHDRRPRREAAVVLASQCVVVGVLGAATAAVGTVLTAALASSSDPLPHALALCLTAGGLDAALALLVLPLVSAALNSAALRPLSTGRPAPPAAPTLPVMVSTLPVTLSTSLSQSVSLPGTTLS